MTLSKGPASFGLCVVVTAGCALPKMNSDWDDVGHAGGVASGDAGRAGNFGSGGVSAAGNSNRGGSTLAGAGHWSAGVSGVAQAGRTNALGGANAAGSPTSGGSAPVSGGTAGALATNGGVGNSAGKPSSGGGTATAGTSSGGMANVGGNVPRGGAAGGAGIAGASGRGGAAGQAGAAGVAGNAGVAGAGGKPVAVRIATGWDHSCAVLSDGTVKCWGSDCRGMLGDGGAVSTCSSEAVYSTVPVSVVGITQATAVAAGMRHACVVEGGFVRCWGYNAYGQLGNNSDTDSSVPVTVLDITTATSVVAGENHTCALLLDGTVRCWGHNSSSEGQLGDGTGTNRAYPVPVVVDTNTPKTPLTGVIGLGSVENHTCAVTSSGAVYCWGNNLSWLQLGHIGYEQQGSTIALLADQLGAAKAVAVGAGRSYSCALLNDSRIRCWGYGNSGELGNGAADNSPTPVLVSLPAGVSGFTAMSVGTYHSCAITSNSDHRAACWGMDQYGELGNNTPDVNAPSPQIVRVGVGLSETDLLHVESIAAGDSHTCAIVAGGTAYCWGRNDMGELGTGDKMDGATARVVVGL